jgi:hypothetical protein
MPQWEYCKRSLGDVPARSDEVDVLNDAGEAGWELVCITSNNIAYMKRPIGGTAAPEPQPKPAARRKAAAPRDTES